MPVGARLVVGGPPPYGPLNERRQRRPSVRPPCLLFSTLPSLPATQRSTTGLAPPRRAPVPVPARPTDSGRIRRSPPPPYPRRQPKHRSLRVASMYIRVKRNKTTYFIQCDPTETILNIKQKLQSITDHPPNNQRLILLATNNILDDSKTLADQKVENDAVVALALRKDNEFEEVSIADKRFLGVLMRPAVPLPNPCKDEPPSVASPKQIMLLAL
ncbi:hypothetical protein ZWY2020_046767 [Hordeum vulgare]|nr:hypothetical protein ZWY2020_046767 [Hordeum vulgare]